MGCFAGSFLREGAAKRLQRWIISVDPCARYSLRRLGFALEREETAVRGDDLRRQGEPRWQDYEYCDNDDPWYDGRNHEYTIVDSPRSGTAMTLSDIKKVLKLRFFGIKTGQSSRYLVYQFLELLELKEELKSISVLRPFDCLSGKSLLSPEDRVAADRWNDRPELGFWLRLPNSFFQTFRALRRS